MSQIKTNPRFTTYCLVHRLTLADAAREVWKFSLWIQTQWRDWKAEQGIKDRWYMQSTQDHHDFDVWLTRRSITE